MMQKPSLLQKARDSQPGFKKPNVDSFVPAEMRDAMQRVVAAGMKIMYAPDMRDELRAEVERDAPIPQKLAEATTGLLLTLDKQSKGGIPMGAIFPAGMELLGEAAEVLQAAGQPVTQGEYNEAAQLMFALMGRKLGASDEDMMGAVRQAVPQEAEEMPAEDAGNSAPGAEFPGQATEEVPA